VVNGRSKKRIAFLLNMTLSLLNAFLFITAFLLMEVVAWATHKYVMHGWLWSWHKSHHKVHPYALEMNDLFALVFSIPSILLIVFGFEKEGLVWLRYIGFGILAYGIFYFIFHDVIVHRRINIKFKARNKYLIGIIRAHYLHHEVHTKNGARAFGFLYSLKKYRQPK
jgi:beta-carotene 3-hydroxylase